MDGNSPSGFTKSNYSIFQNYQKDLLSDEPEEPANMIEVFTMSNTLSQFVDYIFERPWIFFFWF